MSGKFDAAIECLGWHLTDMKACAGKEGLCGDHSEEIAVVEAAIRILEAAGKVDKNDAISTWYWLHSESAIMPPYVPDGSRQIRALLDALPDEVKHE